MKIKDTSIPRSVYAVRCKNNGKLYIGSTIDPVKRFYSHINELRAGAKGTSGNLQKQHWQEDFNKYGADAFELYIMVDADTYSNAMFLESYYIDIYNTRCEFFGYNSNGGGKKANQPDLKIIKGFPSRADGLIF
ncbi:MAG: GIY-YIG nuclease family protein [Clostridia bacterium]|nr:GIY-YIG nuclease family protein [Clostridia bacterium]